MHVTVTADSSGNAIHNSKAGRRGHGLGFLNGSYVSCSKADDREAKKRRTEQKPTWVSFVMMDVLTLRRPLSFKGGEIRSIIKQNIYNINQSRDAKTTQAHQRTCWQLFLSCIPSASAGRKKNTAVNQTVSNDSNHHCVFALHLPGNTGVSGS